MGFQSKLLSFFIAISCAATAYADAPRRLLQGSNIQSSKNSTKYAERGKRSVKLTGDIVTARRFYFRTSDGNLLIVRSSKSMGLVSNLKGLRNRRFTGTIRSGGKIVTGEFYFSQVQHQGRKSIAGVFRVGDRVYELKLKDGYSGILTALSQAALGGCAGVKPAADKVADVAADTDTTGNQSVSTSSAAQVDVLVVYSPEAFTAAGGEAGAAADALNAVDSANLSYANSGLSLTMNLVGVEELEQSEPADIGNALDRLIDPNDGFFDEVQDLRSAYGADVVSMIIENAQVFSGGSYVPVCGIGSLNRSFGPSSAATMFSVVGRSCATGNLSFVHEIGHNMGAHHDRDAASDGNGGVYPAAFSYSYGARFTGTNTVQYRSIMAYAPGSRVAYFSSPNVQYQGVATGTATEDNARTIATTGPLVAALVNEIDDPEVSPTPTPTAVPVAPALSAVRASVANRKCQVTGTVVNQYQTTTVLARKLVTLRGAGVSKRINSNARGAFRFTLSFSRSKTYTLATGRSQKRVTCAEPARRRSTARR